MKRIKIIIPSLQYSIIPLTIFLLMSTLAYSQTVYKVPFLSKDNIIELSIINDTENKLQNLRIEIVKKPEWINIDYLQNEIKEIESKSESVIQIKFSVDKTARINKEEEIRLVITNKTGLKEEKSIKIEIEAPEEFKLEQNYPNPFNPVTKIGYQVPEKSFITIKVYDILGKEIKTLVKENREPGYYEIEFDGSNLPSGLYIYRLASNKTNQNKKMLLIK